MVYIFEDKKLGINKLVLEIKHKFTKLILPDKSFKKEIMSLFEKDVQKEEAKVYILKNKDFGLYSENKIIRDLQRLSDNTLIVIEDMSEVKKYVEIMRYIMNDNKKYVIFDLFTRLINSTDQIAYIIRKENCLYTKYYD